MLEESLTRARQAFHVIESVDDGGSSTEDAYISQSQAMSLLRTLHKNEKILERSTLKTEQANDAMMIYDHDYSLRMNEEDFLDMYLRNFLVPAMETTIEVPIDISEVLLSMFMR